MANAESNSGTESSISKVLTKERNRILKLPLIYGATPNSNGAETIDIVSDFPWTADDSIGNQNVEFKENLASDSGQSKASSIGKFDKKNNIPFCYVVERVSAVNAGIANMLNMISMYNDIVGRAGSVLGDGIDTLMSLFSSNDKTSKTDNPPANTTENNTPNNASAAGESGGATAVPAAEAGKAQGAQNGDIQDNAKSEQPESNSDEAEESSGTSVKKAINSGLKTIHQTINKLIGNTGFKKMIDGNNLNSEIFSPYRFLYITNDSTKKKYVFPLLNGNSSFGSIKNSWGNAAGLPELLQQGLNYLNEGALMVTGAFNFAQNLMGFLSGDGSDVGNVNETAKTFTYPTSGESINIDFVLYNTTKKDAWKRNYQFLYLFTLRNLPFRIDTSSFLPPLLYDIIVPGVKRLPICSVDSIKIVPKGMTRTLSCENFITGSGKIYVNVPEAWEVGITFTSLIASSANMMLGEMIGGLNISTALLSVNSDSSPVTISETPSTEPKQ